MESQPQASHPRLPAECLHKNRLQEYAQRSAMHLPIYETVNEGPPHQPKFRSTVKVDGSCYTSQTFAQLREAEQDAAKVALSNILKKIKEEGCPIINEDMTFCKSIVNEFAVKMNLELPTYKTVQLEGLLPSFVSTTEFHGRTYTGNPGKNKKEAEQLAARDVIQALLVTNASPTVYQIVNAKKKLYAALKVGERNASSAGPSSEKVSGVTIPETTTQPLKKPKLEQSCGPNVVSTGNVASSTDLPPRVNTGLASNQGTTTLPDRKPRPKNEKKVQGEAPTDESLRPGAVSMVQTTPCSVSQ